MPLPIILPILRAIAAFPVEIEQTPLFILLWAAFTIAAALYFIFKKRPKRCKSCGWHG